MNPTELTAFTRIIILDDDASEGAEIRDALAALKLSSLFIHAEDRSALPVEPFPNARIVFLDLEFVPGGTDKSRASTALAYLNTVVREGGFYVLVVWSSHVGSPLETEFREQLDTRATNIKPCIPPIFISKASCKMANGKFSGRKITSHIKQGFKSVKSYELFINWENTVSNTVSDFLSNILNGEDQRELSRKIHALAEAYGGKKYKDNMAKNALLTLDEALKGLLDSSIAQGDYAEHNKYIHKLVSGLDKDKMAELNAKLLLNPDKMRGSGCVFKVTRDEGSSFTGSLVKTWPRGDGVDVMIDVTPICDVAQDKHRFVYYVYGALVPEGTKVSKGGYIYSFDHPFRYNAKNYKLVLNLKSLETVRKNSSTATVKIVLADGTSASGKLVARSIDDNGNIIFKLKDGVIVDFQHKIAHYNSRPGHTLLQPSI